jgi:hypothetical protein
MLDLETWGRWRLLTRGDLDKGIDKAVLPKATLRTLERHVGSLGFEHGNEGKIPRANTFRPYRLTVDGHVAAVIAFRASEAFNLCEVDALWTTELACLAPREATRAALLLAFCDAVKNGGSMSVQFSPECSPTGVPDEVRELAAQFDVELPHASRGALGPKEASELFLCVCGLSAEAREKVRDFSRRGFFSGARVAYLVAHGIWSSDEVADILLSSRYPELLLGGKTTATSRHLAAHASTLARSLILGNLLARALRYVTPQAGDSVLESKLFAHIPRLSMPERLASRHGPLPREVSLAGWDPHGTKPLVLREGSRVCVLPRARSPEAIRAFLRQDLEEARAVAEQTRDTVLVTYPADYLELAETERAEVEAAAKRRGAVVLSCPESVAALETETQRRLRSGRTVRP